MQKNQLIVGLKLVAKVTALSTVPQPQSQNDIDTVIVTGSNPRAGQIKTLLKVSLATSGFEKIAQHLVGVDARSGNKSSKKTSILCLKLLKAGEVLCRCSAV